MNEKLNALSRDALRLLEYLRETEAILGRLTSAATLDPLAALTPREKEMFGLIAQGLSLRAMAMKLGIKENTADSHRDTVRKKLGFGSSEELANFASDLKSRGLFPTPPV